MCRAGEEWRHLWKNYTDKYNWDFAVNREAISKFWEDGIKRNKPYESVITIGMRGEADSELAGSMQYNIDLLKDIILTQKSQLKAEGLENAPKMLVVYKEVEKYWNGNEISEGLKNWKDADGNSPLDDVVIMLCEDNYGNVRSLPVTEKLKNRKGGWGMYYHFDYNGGPRGYMWLNVMQLEKTWEQLSETYDSGIRDIWIVNVGDLKPMEMQISYYMDLAYDFEKYGTNGSVTPGDYYLQFIKQQFSHGVSEVIQAQMAGLLAGYSKLNAICKPEYMREHIYSIENFGEAQSMLDFALFLMEGAELCKKEIPEDLQDAYEQLVYYPVTASANVVALYIYSAYNRYYAEKKDVRTNGYAALVEEAIAKDRELMRHYNEEMSGGKWNKMMSQPHLGYVAWNAENCAPPTPVVLEGVDCPFNKEALLEELMEKEFVRQPGYVVLQADAFTENVPVAVRKKSGEQEKIFSAQFRIIPNYGRSDAAAKVFPFTMELAKQYDETGSVGTLPYLEYEFDLSEDAEYTIRTYLAPSNNLDGDKVELRYALQADGGEIITVNALPEGYISGDHRDPQWCHAVEINAHINESRVNLVAGAHKLRFYGIDAGVLLQKIIVYRGELPESYLGPEE